MKDGIPIILMMFGIKDWKLNKLIYMECGSHLGSEFQMWSKSDFVGEEHSEGGCAIRATISPIFLAEVMAIRNTIFMERCVKEQVAMASHGNLVHPFNTRLRSH